MSLRAHIIGMMSSAAGGVVDSYAVLSNSPDVVADFESATEYFRVGGTETTFASMFDLGTTTAYPTSLATMVDGDGSLKWRPHNLLTYSEDFSNASWIKTNVTRAAFSSFEFINAETITTDATSGMHFIYQATVVPLTNTRHRATFVAKQGSADYIVFSARSVLNIGTVTYRWSNNTFTPDASFSGTLLGTATRTSIGAEGFYLFEIEWQTNSGLYDDVVLAIADATGTKLHATSGLTVVLGAVYLNKNDLGGMVDVPTDQQANALLPQYFQTTTAARYLHRRGHHIWDGAEWVKKGILLETEARTNLLLNSGTLATQDVTTSATPYTLSFTGTGTVTLSGTSTAGPLVGTGTGENNRVNLTFTPTAGTLTLTVSGTVTNAQLEAGSTVSSYIPTAGATVTRAAEASLVPIANVPTIGSVQMKGTITYADSNAASQHTLWRQYKDADEYIVCDIDTDGADTGEINFEQNNAGTLGTVTSDSLSPGINVAFNVASRHGASVINGAVSGTAGTEVTTASTRPTFTTESFSMAHAMNGNVSLLRMWPVVLSDAGIEAASS